MRLYNGLYLFSVITVCICDNKRHCQRNNVASTQLKTLSVCFSSFQTWGALVTLLKRVSQILLIYLYFGGVVLMLFVCLFFNKNIFEILNLRIIICRCTVLLIACCYFISHYDV